MSKVAIIGNGNLGYHISQELAKHHTVQVVTRDNLSTFNPIGFDFVILCVPDGAIASVSESLPISNAIVVHVSGSTDLEALNKHDKRGVIYPLQTFSKEMTVDFAAFPFFVESTPKNLDTIEAFTSTFSPQHHVLGSKERLKLHLAAVMACNFTNHLYQLSDQVLKEIGLSYEDLHHLTEETLNKAKAIGPANAQTGPAIRHDRATIKQHLDTLEGNLKHVYQVLTESIQKN